VHTSSVCALKVLIGVTETMHFVRKVATIVQVVALQVLGEASSVSASELALSAPAEDFVRSITALVDPITDIFEVFTSVIGTNEVVNIAEAFVFLVKNEVLNGRAIRFSITEPFAGNADVGARALVLVVRASLTEQLIRPIVAVVIPVTHHVLVDAGSIEARELTRWAQPAVGFVTEVSAVVELVTYVDSQDASSIGTFELVNVTFTGHFIRVVWAILDTITEPLVRDAISRGTAKLVGCTVASISSSQSLRNIAVI